MLFSSSTQTNLDADQIEPRSYHLRISQNQYHVDLYIDKMRRNEIFTVTSYHDVLETCVPQFDESKI